MNNERRRTTLCVTLRFGEVVNIGNEVSLRCVRHRGRSARVIIEAPEDIRVERTNRYGQRRLTLIEYRNLDPEGRDD